MASESSTRIQYLDAKWEVGQQRQRRRKGHIMALLPLTRRSPGTSNNNLNNNTSTNDARRELVDFRVYVEMAAFLAFHHLETLDNSVLPWLSERLKHCDMSLSYRHHDTQFDPLHAAGELWKAEDSEKDSQPFAILGAARSAVSQAVTYLGSVLEIPQISSSSTAATLDEAPFFARTVPVTGDAHATLYYMWREFGVQHIGVLFIDDAWGRRYEQDLKNFAGVYGIQLKTVPFTNDLTKTDQVLDNAMQQLQNSQLNYFIGAFGPSTWKPVVRAAYNAQLMGRPDKLWILPDILELASDDFGLDKATEFDIAIALHGTGVVNLGLTQHLKLDAALKEMANNTTLLDQFVASHSKPNLLYNFTYQPSASLYQYLTYDAMIALGITACETTGLFTSQEFYDNLLRVDFEGVSGRVSLDPITGTRTGAPLTFPIVNLMLKESDRNDNGRYTFETQRAAAVTLNPNGGTPILEYFQPFVGNDNSGAIPLGLPELTGNLNLIPASVLGVGFGLAVLVMLASLVIGTWVLVKRKTYTIKASQPIFLVQLCVGTFTVASAIIPLGWQENLPGSLDAACISIPWLLFTGFAIAVSALWSKSKRINQLLNSGAGFRRSLVRARDVIQSTVILLAANFVLLTAWMISPWRPAWHRVPVDNNVDEFGRAIASYGTCRYDTQDKLYLIFFLPLLAINAGGLFMATYQSYQARNLPSELGEPGYISMSLVGLCQTCLLGVPVMIVVLDKPTAFFVVSAIAISIGCMAILLPVFLPKYWQRNLKGQAGRMPKVDLSSKLSKTVNTSIGMDHSNHKRNSNGGQRHVTVGSQTTINEDMKSEYDALREKLSRIRKDLIERGQLPTPKNQEIPGQETRVVVVKSWTTIGDSSPPSSDTKVKKGWWWPKGAKEPTL